MFKIISTSKNARLGILKTRHGEVETPFFMPVATKLAVKLISPNDLEKIGLKSIISNAFILYLDPGLNTIKKAKGIHKFMNYNNVIFTDSGGFQMASKAFLESIDEKGVHFRSPIDNSKHFITPEKNMEIQQQLKSDIAMVLDYMPKFEDKRECIEESVKITYEWAKRCKKSHKDKNQLLFGITQGGTFTDLRKKSSELICSLDFDGYAIGGLGMGEGPDLLDKAVKNSVKFMPKNKPRYLMGIGSVRDIVRAIGNGVDIFDSCYVTRHSRHHVVFTKKGEIRINKQKFRNDFTPLDKNCKCDTCKRYTKAYIYHLIKINELTWKRLVTWHNLYFVKNLIDEVKKSIKEDKFEKFKKEFLKNYKVK